MTKRKIDIWDVVIWIGMLVLIAYIIGKLAGLINTPDWVDLLPLISLSFIIGGFYQKILVFMEQMYARTDFLRRNMVDIDNQLPTIISTVSEHTAKSKN